MTLNFECECAIDLGLPVEETAAAVADAALEQLGCPYEWQISLVLTDPEGIRDLNRRFRGIDRATDVLSFPALELTAPGDFSALEAEEYEDCFDPDSGELVLGDIAVNAQAVLDQALEYGHSVRRELAFLVCHSVLHLSGYDHETQEEARQMEQLQEQILEGMGITRS